ncbi:DUF58 domain-containing protein [Gracilibacillus salitolerans]|uniref:DUF58 domain-containing protein n=1 Tax=Gracilibacillus salitolerans TaxID=2663022 RepID=A0A5Q2TEL7_9BACI|nr:DUF58 domain-containing protein [Gracilibacillus salitolerans]QGH33219.1 DUF58 domain-containing protein [Gracilibacillus salitolerans]
MKPMIRKIVRELQLLLLLGILFVFAMFQGGFVSWFLFYSMLPIIFYMLFIPFYPIHHWKIDRKVSDRYLETGGNIEVTITIRRKSPFPMFYLVLEEVLPETLQFQDVGKKKYQYLSDRQSYNRKRHVKKVIYPGFQKEFTIHYRIEHLPRGKHHLSDINLRIGDPFGFVECKYLFSAAKEFFVYPAIQDLKWKQQSMSLEEGTTSSHIHDEKLTNVVSGVREYIPGDRFSWIDWKTTARKNTVMTKEFEQEKDSSIVVILDVGGLQQSQRLVFEAVVEWTASILQSLRKKDQSISFYTFGKSERFFSNQQLQFQFPAVQNYLSTVKQEQVSLAERMVTPMKELSRGSVILFVIHHLDELLVERLSNWKKQDYTLVVCYVIPEKQLDAKEEQYIRSLRLKNISVQTVTEKQLMQEQWEVQASR